MLWNLRSGFRWLVKDPEVGWLWVDSVSLADVERDPKSATVKHRGRSYRLRNRGQARVDHVLTNSFGFGGINAALVLRREG